MIQWLCAPGCTVELRKGGVQDTKRYIEPPFLMLCPLAGHKLHGHKLHEKDGAFLSADSSYNVCVWTLTFDSLVYEARRPSKHWA